MNGKLAKYVITFILGLALVYLVMSLNGFAEAEDARVKYRILADGCTLAGVVIFMSGVLVWISGQGMFYGLGYTMKHLLVRLIPGMGARREERYYDYVTRKQEAKKPKGYGCLLAVGGVFLAATALFTVMFYRF